MFGVCTYSADFPRLYFHHQILLNTVDGVVLIKLFLRRGHEITQARVLVMADQAEIAERIQRASVELNLSV
ncbi:hypothetical protein D3C76_1385070 [compost metagenome]